MRIWFDVSLSTLYEYNRPGGGIGRVERALACNTLEQSRGSVELCIFDEASGKYCAVASETTQQYLKGSIRQLHGRHINFEPHDVFISIGHSNLHGAAVDEMFALPHESGLRLVIFCHDLIPLKSPHLMASQASNSSDTYHNFVKRMLTSSAHILCNSRSTLRDLEDYSHQADLFMPTASILPMGSFILQMGNTGTSQGVTDASSDNAAITISEQLKRTDYVLFVSTLNLRKNHATLVRAWRMLIEKTQDNTPKLVFVGNVGLGSEQLLSDIQTDQNLRKSIVHLRSVDDEQLRWLYQNCLFSVFPSFYEGWGLPVSEALSCGKFCLASSSSSIPEAGGPFAEYIAPGDIDKWAERISFYNTCREALHEKESFIKRHYKAVSWSHSARVMLELVGSFES